MSVLLHLSDIHFRRTSGQVHDIDADLRNELLLDAESVAKSLGSPDAILVGGDVAFSGKKVEYDIAHDWLEELCDRVGVSFATVWCVPGNHDVDQACIKASPLLRDMQETIRGASNAHDTKLTEYLTDPAARSQLYSSIAAFNAFAEPHGFMLSADKPFHRFALVLNDGSDLCINALNSTIVSNHRDLEFRKVVLGRYQLPVRDAGVTNLVLCHHPPDWWADPDQLKHDFLDRAHIQLYGHKHEQFMERVNNCIRLSAGAVHPSRAESNWRPRYNWLTLRVDGSGSERKLRVAIYPRALSESVPRFIPDSNSCAQKDHAEISLDLDPWTSPSIPGPPAYAPSADAVQVTSGDSKAMDNPVRILAFRLFELPYLTRLTIAQSLGLVRNEDAGLRDYEVFRRVLQRAADEGTLASLWNQVQAKHNDGKFKDNPFETKEERT